MDLTSLNTRSMYVCMYVCMYVVCMYVCIYVCRMYVCKYVCMYVSIFKKPYTYIVCMPTTPHSAGPTKRPQSRRPTAKTAAPSEALSTKEPARISYTIEPSLLPFTLKKNSNSNIFPSSTYRSIGTTSIPHGTISAAPFSFSF